MSNQAEETRPITTELVETPSGRFKFRLKRPEEVPWGVMVEVAEVLDTSATFDRDAAGSVTVRNTHNRAIRAMTEIWAATAEILVREYDEDGEPTYKPLEIARSDDTYHKGEFIEWLKARRPYTDVVFVRDAVERAGTLDADPNAITG